MKKSDRARIQSFGIYIKLLTINWTVKRSNKSGLEVIGEFKRLVDEIEQRKLQFMGHIIRQMCL